MAGATIGVITTCHTYRHWMPEWGASVATLHRQPDKVVVASTDEPGDIGCEHEWVKPRCEWSWPMYLNTAVEACDTDWIVWIGADDTFLPHALDGWADLPVDVVSFGLADMDGAWTLVREAPSGADVYDAVHGNMIGCDSPFRRWLWEGVPFETEVSWPFNDWAFWISCAWQGAVFGATGRKDFLYRTHPDQVRIPDEPTLSRIKVWRDHLGR